MCEGGDFDLEAELFDDLYASAEPSAAVFHLLNSPQAANQVVSVPKRTAVSQQRAAISQQRMSMAAKKSPESTQQSRLRELRRKSDDRVAQSGRGQLCEVLARVDHSLASVVANAILEKRTKNVALPRQMTGSARFLYNGGAGKVDIEALEKEFMTRFCVRGASVRIATAISVPLVDEMIQNLLKGTQYDRIETLFEVFNLQSRDQFDKLVIIREEFNTYLNTRVVEEELTAFFNLMFCPLDQPLQERLDKVRATCNGIPHLWILYKEPGLRFRIGRAATCAVRALVMIYQHAENFSNEIDRTVRDLQLVMGILLKHILAYFPILRKASLASAGGKENGIDNPLDEKAILVCRSAVEDAVAAPVFHSVLQPLYLTSEYGAQDAQVESTCKRVRAEFQPMEVLKYLLVHDSLLLPEQRIPYMSVIDMFCLAWDASPGASHGPTGKVRLLVRATREIPRYLARVGKNRNIGADDLLPIFVFCVIWSAPRQLASSLHFIENVLLDTLLTSESGYALALTQTALQTILNFDIWDQTSTTETLSPTAVEGCSNGLPVNDTISLSGNSTIKCDDSPALDEPLSEQTLTAPGDDLFEYSSELPPPLAVEASIAAVISDALKEEHAIAVMETVGNEPSESIAAVVNDDVASQSSKEEKKAHEAQDL